jgi:hypothetical protein
LKASHEVNVSTVLFSLPGFRHNAAYLALLEFMEQSGECFATSTFAIFVAARRPDYHELERREGQE